MTHVILFTEVLVCPQLSSLSCMCRAAKRSAVLHFISTANRSCSTSPTLWEHTHSSPYRKKCLDSFKNKCSIFSRKGDCKFYFNATHQPYCTKCCCMKELEHLNYQHWQFYAVISFAEANTHTQMISSVEDFSVRL